VAAAAGFVLLLVPLLPQAATSTAASPADASAAPTRNDGRAGLMLDSAIFMVPLLGRGAP
jgi:hypothetical protein